MDTCTQIDLPRSLFKTMKAIHIKVALLFAEQNISITPQQFFILRFISESQGMIQQDLAQLMKIDKSSMLRQLDALQKEMLVARIPNTEDKRKKNLVLTQKGGELFKEVSEIAETFFKTLGEGISKEELDVFYSVLSKIKENTRK